LDRNTHERLRALLVDGKRAERGRPATSFLGGFVRCARCGGKMHQTRQRGLRIYRCHAGAVTRLCRGVLISADPLDEFIEKVILHRISTKAVARALSRPADTQVSDADVEDVAVIDADLEALATEFGQGRISRREWLAARGPLEQRKQAALALLDRSVVGRHHAAAKLSKSGDVPKAWRAATVEQRREIVQDLAEKITVGPTLRHGTNAFDPDRVDVVWKV